MGRLLGTMTVDLTKRKARRITVYSALIGVFWALTLWQPWEIDWFPRKPLPFSRTETGLLLGRPRVVIITAHPDDSEFYIGATATILHKQGASMHHIVVTDGDKGYYPFEEADENRVTRRAEQDRASGTWGAKPVYLSFPDGRLRNTPGVRNAIWNEIERIQPDYVLTFDGLYPPRMSHQDHRRSGDATEQVLREKGWKGWLMRFSTRSPNYVLDITDYWETKKQLLALHKSQFFGTRLEGIINMVGSRAERDGELIDTLHGEGFRCERL